MPSLACNARCRVWRLRTHSWTRERRGAYLEAVRADSSNRRIRPTGFQCLSAGGARVSEDLGDHVEISALLNDAPEWRSPGGACAEPCPPGRSGRTSATHCPGPAASPRRSERSSCVPRQAFTPRIDLRQSFLTQKGAAWNPGRFILAVTCLNGRGLPCGSATNTGM
jgi:hypothetical protein